MSAARDEPGFERSAPPVATPGAAITNLRAVRQQCGDGASGLGALGFLAARRDARDWSQLLIVSNHHVLHAHGAAPGEPIYQPAYRADEGRLTFERDPQPVAELEEGGFEGDWRYAYPGEPERNYFVDCAAAALVDGPERGAARGPVLFTSIARASRLDAQPGREIGLYKLGRDRGPTGKLVATDATVRLADGTTRANNLVVRSLPGPDGASRRFAAEGDSGALVLDRLHRAIGLVWGVNLEDPAEAYACHIHPVLDCLKLVPYRHGLRPHGPDRQPAGEARRGTG